MGPFVDLAQQRVWAGLDKLSAVFSFFYSYWTPFGWRIAKKEKGKIIIKSMHRGPMPLICYHSSETAPSTSIRHHWVACRRNFCAVVFVCMVCFFR
jgi:hypothetical protein